MNCPVCNNPEAEELIDEIDIGVGTLTNLRGYECPDCGVIPVCDECKCILDREDHADWCSIND